MKPASLSDIRKELKLLHESELVELCLRLARHKVENKELLSYLLFDAANEEEFVKLVKEEVETKMEDVNIYGVYYAKKGLRKILRYLNKVIRFSRKKETEVELRIHFLHQINERGIPIQRSSVLTNLYQGQVKKIKAAISKLHEDLQYDFGQELEALLEGKG